MNDLEKFAMISGQKSNRVFIKKNKYVGIGHIGKCALCQKVREIRIKRHSLCASCHSKCTVWILRKYGKYNKLKVSEAIEFYVTPKKCEFCGEVLVSYKEKGQMRKYLCKKCKEIYKLAYSDINRNKRSGRYRINEILQPE